MNFRGIVRNRKKQSRFKRLLQQFIDDLRNRMFKHRERLHSLMWSFSVHGSVLSVLALVSLPMGRIQKRELITIEALADGNETGELDTLALDFAASDSIETQEPLLSEEFSVETLEQLTVAANLQPSMTAEPSDSEEGALPDNVSTGLASLGNDELRIAEADRRVGAAGGNLKAPIRVSLLFDGDDDLDLDLQYRILKTNRDRADIDRLFEPHINFILRTNPHGTLDVDANALRIVPRPCENIIITDPPLLADYTVRVNLFRARGDRIATPIIVVIRYGDKTKVFKDEIPSGQRSKTIHTFRYARK